MMQEDTSFSSAMVAPHIHGLRTDDEFQSFMRDSRKKTVLVEFGSSWCAKCHEIFPFFYALSKKNSQLTYAMLPPSWPAQNSQLTYAIAQVDYMREAIKGIKYSPTFAVYRNGRKVDEWLGKDQQKLADRVWLHSD